MGPRILILAASWYAMMIVHELGHVLGAWATGSILSGVTVPWFGLSHTDVVEYRHAAWVVAMGPIVGVVLPLTVWILARRFSVSEAWLLTLRFFAGFCLVANGAYMMPALVSPAGDTEDLLSLGVPGWAISVPGLASLAGGLWLWNGLGSLRIATHAVTTPGLVPASVWFAGVTATTMLGLMLART